VNVVHRYRGAEFLSEGYYEFGVSRAIRTQVMIHVVNVERESGGVRQEGHPHGVGTARNGQRDNVLSCGEYAPLEEFARRHVVTIRPRQRTSF
jgi:hypothetical protein